MNWSFLERLLSQSSVSGNEDNAINCFEEELRQYCHSIYRDALNNCYAILNPQNEHNIMIEAHIDEIGFQVTYIDENGLIYIRQCGGVDCACISGSLVEINAYDGTIVKGIIGKRPMHIQKPEERAKVPELEELWVDTALDGDEVRSKISIGDYVSFASNYHRLGKYGIVSKGLDNKIGVYVVTETMKRLSSETLSLGVCGVATVQEEIGCKGAKVCSHNIMTQMSISIDVGFATDVPNISKKKYGDIALGDGPIINHHTDCSRPFISIVKDVAAKKQITYQNCANSISTGGTNTASIQTSYKGIQTLLLSIPNRYMHTQVELCDYRDVESTINLLVETILYIDKNKLL